MQAAASPHLEVTFPHSRSFPLLRSVLLTPKLYPWHERGSRRVVVESDRGVEGFVVKVNETLQCDKPKFHAQF